MCPGVLALTHEQGLGTPEALCPDEVLTPSPWVAGLWGGSIKMFVLYWLAGESFRVMLKVPGEVLAYHPSIGVGGIKGGDLRSA